MTSDVAQAFRPNGIDFDCDHVGPGASECKGQHAASCTYLHDELAGLNAGVVYEPLSPPGDEEILTETATSLVSVGPPPRGHGEPPSHPCRICTRSGERLQRRRP